jgi:translation initiation factor IF-3
MRVNRRIRASKVRLISSQGVQLGIFPTHKAIAIAKEEGLDLVEVNPRTDPPVCKIMDYGKYKYQQKKKAKKAKKQKATTEIKEVKIRPKTEEHDFQVKLKHITRFLQAGHKVKVSVRFRGREIIHPEQGKKQLNQIIQEVKDQAIVEKTPKMEARNMTIMLTPKR